MKSKYNFIKVALVLAISIMFSACGAEPTKDVKFTIIPDNLSVRIGQTQKVDLLASIYQNVSVQEEYIEKLEVISIDAVNGENYQGKAQLILQADSDGVSSKSFDLTGEEVGRVAFEIVVDLTFSKDADDVENRHLVLIEAEIINEVYEESFDEIASSEDEDKEAQAISDNISVSAGNMARPTEFPHLNLPEYMNLSTNQMFAFSLNQDLKGHSIRQVSFGNGVARAYIGTDEKSGEMDLRIIAGDSVNSGYVKIYLSYPNYFYNASSVLPQENPNGPYYSVENGYLVIMYDVNIKENLSNTKPLEEYYVENELNKDEYNPMIKN